MRKLNGKVIYLKVVHRIVAKLAPNWKKKKLYTRSYEILNTKKVSILSDLKVVSFVHKSLFYRPEHNAKEGIHQNGF